VAPAPVPAAVAPAPVPQAPAPVIVQAPSSPPVAAPVFDGRYVTTWLERSLVPARGIEWASRDASQAERESRSVAAVQVQCLP